MPECAGMTIGDATWRRRAQYASPFYGDVEACAAALKKAVRSLVQRGYPLRLAEFHRPSDFHPWLIDRLNLFAIGLSSLHREDPLAYRAIMTYELRAGSRWPKNGQWCAGLGCSMQEAKDAAWRGWRRLAEWICEDD